MLLVLPTGNWFSRSSDVAAANIVSNGDTRRVAYCWPATPPPVPFGGEGAARLSDWEWPRCAAQDVFTYDGCRNLPPPSSIYVRLDPGSEVSLGRRKPSYDQTLGVGASAASGRTISTVYPRSTATRGIAAIARLPVPPTPGGMALRDFGKLMNWGTGHTAARSQISNLTKEGLQRAGVTPEIAGAWAQFYRNEAARVASNPSALGRAELMEAAAALFQ